MLTVYDFYEYEDYLEYVEYRFDYSSIEEEDSLEWENDEKIWED